MFTKFVCLNPEDFPAPIQSYITNAIIVDNSSSPCAKTYYLEKDSGYFLKIADKNKLQEEAIMTDYFYNKGLSAKVYEYISNHERDYLVTGKIKGENGISPEYLDNPEKLCDVFAESLFMLHNNDFSDCSNKNRTSQMLNSAREQYKTSKADMELLKYLEISSINNAYDTMLNLKDCYSDDALIHGDYCLPNIILDDFRFSGFIDVGYGGVGDRHYDIFWALWTLNFNLKTDKYKSRFIDVYGHGKIDKDRLMFCGIISALTGE